MKYAFACYGKKIKLINNCGCKYDEREVSLAIINECSERLIPLREGYQINLSGGYPAINLWKVKIRLHQLIAKWILGITDPECTHHLDRDKLNAKSENIFATTKAEHVNMHRKDLYNEKRRNSMEKIFSSEEYKQKMSKAKKGHIVSKETREKLSKANKGKVLSVERRKRLSEAHRGRKLSEATKKKLSISRKGYKVSDESRRRMCLAQKLRREKRADVRE